MPLDLADVLNDTYLQRGLRFRVATVIGTNPFTIRYGEDDAPQPASRISSYAPVAGHLVYVIQRGRGQSVVLGQLVTSSDQGGGVPIPPGGLWSANMLNNGGYEYGFATWGPAPFVSDATFARCYRLVDGIVADSIYAMEGRSFNRISDGTLSAPVAHRLVQAATVAIVPGATYKISVKARSTGMATSWFSALIGDTQEHAWGGNFWYPDNAIDFNFYFSRMNPSMGVQSFSYKFTVPSDPKWKWCSIDMSAVNFQGDPPNKLNDGMIYDNVQLQRQLA